MALSKCDLLQSTRKWTLGPKVSQKGGVLRLNRPIDSALATLARLYSI